MFVNQPNTTTTGKKIRDTYNGDVLNTGNPISVKITDKTTGQTVNSNATVTLTLSFNPAGGSLSGGSVAAVAGVATFPNLSINTAGPYKLRASSSVASNAPNSDQFLVSDVVTTCAGTGCSFQQTAPITKSTFTITPKNGTAGAHFVSTIDLSGVTISCNFAPFNYPDSRQPNTVFFIYDEGNGSSIKTGVINIDKGIVQITPENGASKYRICYASPDQFKDRTGGDAKQDAGLTAFFGVPWYIGLLADCSGTNPPLSELPCSLGFTGTGSGNRLGTFLAPPGDPFIR